MLRCFLHNSCMSSSHEDDIVIIRLLKNYSVNHFKKLIHIEFYHRCRLNKDTVLYSVLYV